MDKKSKEERRQEVIEAGSSKSVDYMIVVGWRWCYMGQK